ncbi:ferritin-like domain-containing protein [Sphingomonadaceae bacterium OTU29LAMAA1]|nr:ferritin-like domain-containing protein [Sphingomonadaceae bacterium OTU29LAMAA1]
MKTYLNQSRRAFMRKAAVFASSSAVGTVSTAALAANDSSSDADEINLAINLLYLQAQYYTRALGSTIPATLPAGSGAGGSVEGGTAVTFADPLIRACAEELAADKVAHIVLLRQLLGSNAVSQPAIDVSAKPSGSFSTFMRFAGLIDGASAFDPYSSDDSFLLGAFITEDVMPTLWRASVAQIVNPAAREIAAGMLATSAHHAALIRSLILDRAIVSPGLIAAVQAISDTRDRFDGGTEIDQGLGQMSRAPGAAASTIIANIAPTDAFGSVYSRGSGPTLGIMYMTAGTASNGGFFPAGVNGTLKTSAPA